jgi:hypothetical protein
MVCLHPKAAFPVRLIRRFFPGAFRWDEGLIQAIALTNDVAELQQEVNLYVFTFPPEGFLAKYFFMRISGQKVVNLAIAVFGKGAVANPGQQSRPRETASVVS